MDQLSNLCEWVLYHFIIDKSAQSTGHQIFELIGFGTLRRLLAPALIHWPDRNANDHHPNATHHPQIRSVRKAQNCALDSSSPFSPHRSICLGFLENQTDRAPPARFLRPLLCLHISLTWTKTKSLGSVASRKMLFLTMRFVGYTCFALSYIVQYCFI